MTTYEDEVRRAVKDIREIEARHGAKFLPEIPDEELIQNIIKERQPLTMFGTPTRAETRLARYQAGKFPVIHPSQVSTGPMFIPRTISLDQALKEIQSVFVKVRQTQTDILEKSGLDSQMYVQCQLVASLKGRMDRLIQIGQERGQDYFTEATVVGNNAESLRLKMENVCNPLFALLEDLKAKRTIDISDPNWIGNELRYTAPTFPTQILVPSTSQTEERQTEAEISRLPEEPAEGEVPRSPKGRFTKQTKKKSNFE